MDDAYAGLNPVKASAHPLNMTYPEPRITIRTSLMKSFSTAQNLAETGPPKHLAHG
jgi:hypothetical protein